ncbi:hypothetical protein ABVK25_003295 [Lepraria finkii]|uniref:Importin N-terminal domain-containing protein n=1 Tax=Lepraria finkii TaxID=1340010 RepID=A0ABR4BEI8_9LECA
MDAAALRNRIQSTVDPNADVRRQAELDLKFAEERPGFMNALLDILQAEQDNSIRLSSVVYLKNRVSRAWQPNEDSTTVKRISDEEKIDLRNRLLPILASSQQQIRAQLIPVLQKVLSYDFPEKWPNFLNLTLRLLNTNDANSVHAGLNCMLAICRMYRFKGGETREDFNRIVEASFPQLLGIATRLVEEMSPEAWEMVHIIMKTYKHAIYFDLPPHLMSQNQMVGWCTLFLTIVGKDAPEHALDDDFDERERNHFWKSKKWAYANLNRLFVRYGSPSTNQKNTTSEMALFTKSFLVNFAPEILKGYLQQIEKWASKTAWLSKPSLSYSLSFLDECVKPKSMWNHLKPHMDTLISHVLFPILCQSDEDIELFDSDPSEYLHRKLNFYEEVSAPDVAATNFLVSLTKSRKKQTFTILNFVNGVVNKYEAAPDDQKDPREKEGALRMIGTLASVILGKKSPIADQVEYFFVRHVFPEFRSPHGFLRARACDTLGKFEQLEFKEQSNVLHIYRNILESMADPALPVRVEAALALQPLIRHEVIRTSMQQNIPQIMQQLLKLANEVDVDALANVMEDFVEEFAAELTPFAVALSEQLRDTYLRIVRELVDRQSQKGEEDETYGDFLDDKSITALGVLQTIGTLILTLEATPDVLSHLETILMPVIQITLENKLYDLYNEVFEIIDSCTFSAKIVSPTMWQAFVLMHKTFKSGAELYLEDMLPALDNFIMYGAETMVQNPAYVEALVGMVSDIFHDEKVGGMDRICGCKLSEAIMLNLRGHVDRWVPTFVELAMSVLASNELKVKSYRIHLMEMIINAIYYNPLIALQILESNGWTNKFFSSWFSNIEGFTRVHDKKLSICAISALLTLNANEVPTSVQQGWPRLLQGVVRLFQTLPAALKHREEFTKENDFTLNDDDDDDEEEEFDEWDGETAWANEGEDAEDVKDESAAYLEFLKEESEKFAAGHDDSDDELEEESLLETPLDKVEPYGLFKETLMKLQQEHPQLYQNLTKILNPDEQQIVQAVIVQADANVIAAQAIAASAAAQNQTNGGTR